MFSKFFSIIIVCFILLFFTACKNSDNDSSSVPLTEEQKFEQEAVTATYTIANDLEKTITKKMNIDEFIAKNVVDYSSITQEKIKLMDNEKKKLIIKFLKEIKFGKMEGSFSNLDKLYKYEILIQHQIKYRICAFVFDNKINDYIRITDITLYYDYDTFKIGGI